MGPVPLIRFALEAHSAIEKVRRLYSKYQNDVMKFSADHYAPDNTSPILPPSSIIVVWLCAKIRQLITCMDMYIC